MALFTRNRLSRGVRIATQAVFGLLSQIAVALSAATIERVNLSTPWAPFRINLHVPLLDADYFNKNLTANQRVEFCVPFVLPPLQEFWQSTGIPGADCPQVVLDEVSFSFDQCGEPAAITGQSHATAPGLLDFTNLEGYDIRISLLEKQQWFFDNTVSNVPDREVFSASIPPEAFAGRMYRFNPFVVADLSRVLHPFRTYVLVVKADSLQTGAAASTKFCMPAFQVSLRCRHPLVARDDDAVQNIPSVHGGGKAVAAFTVTSPAGGTGVEADGADGLFTGLSVLERALAARLRGGYGKDSDPPPTEQLADDAAYDVIAVPMWSYAANSSILDRPNSGQVAYQPGVPPHNVAACDARHIRLGYPWSLHHAFAIPSYANPTNGVHPASATFYNRVGVLLGCDGDWMGYQQAAYCEWTPSTGAVPKAGITVDRIRPYHDSTLGADAGEPWDYEVLACPLVRDTDNPNGAGYYTQGQPFFCGRSSSRTEARRNVGAIGGAPGVQSQTRGYETFLEVRWELHDSGGLEAPATLDTYVGYGGHWVILIGKKHLAAPGVGLDL